MGEVVPLPTNGPRRDGRAKAEDQADGQVDADVVELGLDDDFDDDLDDDFDDDLDDDFDDDLDDDFDDEADAELIRQWEEAERECVEVLRAALPQVRAAAAPAEEIRSAAQQIRQAVAAGEPPHVNLVSGAGWPKALPGDDYELWLGATGALTSPRMDSGLDSETEAGLMSLELADWVGAVIGLVRAGVGAYAEPENLVDYIDDCPEVEGETDPDDAVFLETAFYTVTKAWRATGALDFDNRLTPLGWWGLPRALGWAWQTDFDADPATAGNGSGSAPREP
jgi:hypothetical protein